MPRGEEDSSIEFPLALRFGDDDARKALTAKDIGCGGGRREEGGGSGEWRVESGGVCCGKGEKKDWRRGVLLVSFITGNLL